MQTGPRTHLSPPANQPLEETFRSAILNAPPSPLETFGLDDGSQVLNIRHETAAYYSYLDELDDVSVEALTLRGVENLA